MKTARAELNKRRCKVVKVEDEALASTISCVLCSAVQPPKTESDGETNLCNGCKQLREAETKRGDGYLLALLISSQPLDKTEPAGASLSLSANDNYGLYSSPQTFIIIKEGRRRVGKKDPLIKQPISFCFFWKRYSVTIRGTMQSLEVADVAALVPSVYYYCYCSQMNGWTLFCSSFQKEKSDTPGG